jgi:hypothetical protein
MSHSAQKKKKGSNFTINMQIIPQMKISNFSTSSKVNNPKDISHELPMMITPLDFIKQKKKFIIQDSFDKRGAQKFLKSKEVAMMEIKLDDEILDDIKNKNNCNSNSYFFETNPDTNYYKNSDRVKQRKNTISPILSKRKSKFGKIKYSHFVKNIDDNKNSEKNINNFDNIFINNKNDDDSKGSDFVYKFILDNANETEDNFQKKYEKIIKDAENKQKNKNLKNNIYQTTIVKNKRNSQKYKSVKSKRKRLSTFTFSEIAKNLMKNEGLKESSISITSGNNIKLVKRNSVVNSVKISGKNNDVFLEQKDIEDSKNEESIISILGNLV